MVGEKILYKTARFTILFGSVIYGRISSRLQLEPNASQMRNV